MTWIVNVTQTTFDEEVIQRSREVPVVVDFWAPWCGPCRVLGPVLEKLCREMNGKFVLAKVNTDENQWLAMQYNVRGIPAVKAFLNGKVVDEFVGALPESAVKRWLEGIVPSAADRLVSEAKTDPERAEELARKALEMEPRHVGASVLLAKALLEKGEREEARNLIDGIEVSGDRELEQELARIRLALESGESGDLEELRDALERDPTDLETKHELAMALVAQCRYEEALQHLLDIVGRDKGQRRERARRAMVEIFEALGPQSALAERYRNELANLLYS